MIKINGVEAESTGSIAHIIREKNYINGRLAVLVNGIIVKKADWENFMLKDGDEVEIVSFVGGG